MKVSVNFECTPEEARRFLGLPDVTRANDIYVDNLAKTLQGGASFEQMQDIIQQVAPVGQIGLKLFQQFIEGTAAATGGAGRRDD